MCRQEISRVPWKFNTTFHIWVALVFVSMANTSVIFGIRQISRASTAKSKMCLHSSQPHIPTATPIGPRMEAWKDWTLLTSFWRQLLLMSPTELPSFIKGSPPYQMANLEELEKAGHRSEFHSKDSRYSKSKTYAMSFGYDGTKFFGFQSQKNSTALAVEDSLKQVVKRGIVVAGRTDKNVSAIQQIICFNSPAENFHETMLQNFLSHPTCVQGDLRVFDCVRVPRKFNARSSPIWRRYLYVIPLDYHPDTGKYDIDVEFVNEALSKLENQNLPYNAFAYQKDRDVGEGMKDTCILYRARAHVIDMSLYKQVSPEFLKEPNTRARSRPGLCIELVGNRFLRQMVRRLVSTLISQGIETDSNNKSRDPNFLYDICLSGDRKRCARPFPGEGLCLAGVGFDTVDLSFYKFMPKEDRARIMKELGVEAGRGGVDDSS